MLRFIETLSQITDYFIIPFTLLDVFKEARVAGIVLFVILLITCVVFYKKYPEIEKILRLLYSMSCIIIIIAVFFIACFRLQNENSTEADNNPNSPPKKEASEKEHDDTTSLVNNKEDSSETEDSLSDEENDKETPNDNNSSTKKKKSNKGKNNKDNKDKSDVVEPDINYDFNEDNEDEDYASSLEEEEEYETEEYQEPEYTTEYDYNSEYSKGYKEGEINGQYDGYQKGYDDGINNYNYNVDYSLEVHGFGIGYEAGFKEAYDKNYAIRYDNGYWEAKNENSEQVESSSNSYYDYQNTESQPSIINIYTDNYDFSFLKIQRIDFDASTICFSGEIYIPEEFYYITEYKYVTFSNDGEISDTVVDENNRFLICTDHFGDITFTPEIILITGEDIVGQPVSFYSAK